MRHFLLTLVSVGALCIANAHAAALTVPSADKEITIALQLEETWKTEPAKGSGVTIEIPRSGVHIQVWALSQTSMDEAAKQAADLIKDQVTNFKVTATKEIRVADAAAKQLTGTGEEADDGDPSNAEVYIFAVEGKIFLVCAHGEGDGTVKNRAVLTTLLESVKKI
jgi:hypothetical protein